MRSASSISFQALAIPSFSIGSSDSLSPAVSTMFTGKPFTRIWSRNTSLVVPAIDVTIAVSFPDKAFKRLDLPAFGLPARTRVIPSLKREPCLASLRRSFKLCCNELSLPNSRSSFKKSTSSSGKSIAASTYIRM